MTTLNRCLSNIKGILFKGTASAVAVSTGFLMLPQAALAQSSGGAIEEVVVTAQYREQNMQEVPIAITALTGDSLASKSASNVIDIGKWTPNLTIDHLGTGWGPTVAISARGMGLNDFKAVFEPAVPIYVDDVLLGKPTGAVLDLLDLDRVEVLRGPQGTLFGSNAAGGVIRLISRKPTGDGPATAEITMGSYNRLDMRGSFEVALGKNLFARFSGSSKHRDGYVTILDFTCDMIRKGTPQLAGIGDGLGADGSAGAGYDGQPDVVPVGSVADNAFGIPISTSPNGTDNGCKIGEMGDEDVQSGRAIVRWVASNDLEFTLTSDITNENQHSPADYLAGVNPNLFLVSASNRLVNIPNFGVPYDNRFVPTDPYTSYSTFKDPGVTWGVPGQPGSGTSLSQSYPGGPDTPNVMQVLHWGVSGKMDWNINQDLNATVILAYRNFNSYFGRDSDGSPIPLNHTLDTYKDEQYTIEGRLSGNLNWMAYTTEWTTGVFYYDAKDYNSNISILHMGIIGAGDVDRIDDQKSTKLGVFLHTITNVTDKIRFTAGVRWTHDSKDIVQYRPKRILEDRPLVTADYLFPPTPLGIDSFRVSPMASLSYQWNDDIMTYFTWARGFRGGGFNPRPSNLITLGTFGPEDVENFEIGAKTDLFDKRLRFNISTFYMDYKHLQLPAVVQDCPTCIPTFPTKNAGSADIAGVEVDFDAVPFENFTIDGTFGWLGFSYVSLGNADPAVVAAAGFSPIGSPCLDCRPLRSPEITATLGSSYTFNLNGGDWGRFTVRGDISFRSKTNFTQNNFQRANQGAYYLLNARGTWTSPGGDWEVDLAGTNINNKLYKVSVLDFMDSLGGIEYGFGNPREWSVSIKKHF